MIWTVEDTVQTLRRERAQLLQRWRTTAQSHLWHVSPRFFEPDSEVSRVIDTLINTISAYFETYRTNTDANLSETPASAIETELMLPQDEAPVTVWRSMTDMPGTTNYYRYAFNLAQPQVLQCARQVADLSLTWVDIRATLNLLATTLRETLMTHQVDRQTLDLVDGFVEAVTAMVADLRVQQLEQQLASREEEAVTTQHLASRFLGNASHELRTPLTAILGFAELLAEESYGPLTPQQAIAIGHIDNSAQNLLEIINNMLDLLHIRAGKLNLRYRQINLKTVLENLYLILTPLAGRKNVEFEYERDAAPGVMEADEDIVRHIVYYLLSSALRATPSGGKVTLHAWQSATHAGIEVRDTGLHLPPEAMANMGHPFPRLENSPTRGYEGWEVGLPLVRRYVDLHHGALEIENLPQQGTRFRVALPLKRVDPAAVC